MFRGYGLGATALPSDCDTHHLRWLVPTPPFAVTVTTTARTKWGPVSRNCSAHRVPRGHVDPIRSAADAIAVLALVAPFGHDSVAILLDDQRRGHGIVVVTGTTDADALFRLIDLCIETSVQPETHDTSAVILASSRPGGDMEAADAARWIEADLQCDDGGLELVEWFVIGHHVACPRDLVGDPPRW